VTGIGAVGAASAGGTGPVWPVGAAVHHVPVGVLPAAPGAGSGSEGSG